MRRAWLIAMICSALWLAIMITLLVWLVQPSPAQSQPERGLVIATANIKVDLGKYRARADLRKAAHGADVVLAQEMQHRAMDLPGFGRAQTAKPSRLCREVPVYWRQAALTKVSSRAFVIQRGDGLGLSRCVLVVRLQERSTGRIFVVINVHQAQAVERGGHPRMLRALTYEEGMQRLQQIINTTNGPLIVGGDWNVNLKADCKVRWWGFPCYHLNARLNPTHTYGTLGSRQVDVIWFSSAWRNAGDWRIMETYSDHRFVKVHLTWR